MNELTSRQLEIMAFISRCVARDARAPTRQEIATHFGFRSINAAETHLQALARKGAIALTGGTARGISLPTPARNAVSSVQLPVLGRVAAGEPILALENLEYHVEVSTQLFQPMPDFLLRVKGLSMRDAGILDGDLLAVKRAATANNGQIVVARVNDEVTVKRWYLHGEQLQLRPENLDFSPLQVDLAHTPVELIGHGVGVIRQRLSN